MNLSKSCVPSNPFSILIQYLLYISVLFFWWEAHKNVILIKSDLLILILYCLGFHRLVVGCHGTVPGIFVLYLIFVNHLRLFLHCLCDIVSKEGEIFNNFFRILKSNVKTSLEEILSMIFIMVSLSLFVKMSLYLFSPCAWLFVK